MNFEPLVKVNERRYLSYNQPVFRLYKTRDCAGRLFLNKAAINFGNFNEYDKINLYYNPHHGFVLFKHKPVSKDGLILRIQKDGRLMTYINQGELLRIFSWFDLGEMDKSVAFYLTEKVQIEGSKILDYGYTLKRI